MFKLVSARKNVVMVAKRHKRAIVACKRRNYQVEGVQSQKELWEHWKSNPIEFWAKQAREITWFEPWDTTLDSSNPPFYKWFKGGTLNTCYNAVDRHLKTRPNQNAVVWQSPVTGNSETWTYAQLHDKVTRIAGGLRAQGVEKGDTVLIYMPMVPQACATMLACARIGAVHSVVFGGFAPDRLAIRIDHSKPKVIVIASFGIEKNTQIPYKDLVDRALEASKHSPKSIIVYQRPNMPQQELAQPYIDFEALLKNSKPEMECTPMAANDPLYTLYTSGTTGTPKAVVRDNGGHAVAVNFALQQCFGMKAGDTFWAASDIGWVVGHSFIVYSQLIAGCTTIMYEGKPIGTPDASAFWRVISNTKCNGFFVAPTAMRAIRGEDPDGLLPKKFDLSSLKYMFVAGEKVDPETLAYCQKILPDIPVIDNYWQTESGWPMLCNMVRPKLNPTKPGSSGLPVPGWDMKIVDHETGKELPEGEEGTLVAKLPLPPGAMTTLWPNDDNLMVEKYFRGYPGFYDSGDTCKIDKDGYAFIMSRSDDVINVAGHRIACYGLEEIVREMPEIAECAIFGIKDDYRGEVPIGVLQLKSGEHQRSHEEIIKATIDRVRTKFGAFACFKSAGIVTGIPKTKSGKVMRNVLRKIANGEPYEPGTIEDESVLQDVEDGLRKMGFPKN